MRSIAEGHARFREEVFPEHEGLFAHLDKGQSPETLIVSCSDSRVDLNWVTQSRPGDIFHVRNAGNLVPPSSTEPEGVVAAIQYALLHLPVRDLVVCGHSRCGAMQAALAGVDDHATDPVSLWLRHAAKPEPGMTLDELVRANVLEQLEHLSSHDFVASRTAEGSLSLWGWVYLIGSSEILQLDRETGELRSLQSTPHSIR